MSIRWVGHSEHRGVRPFYGWIGFASLVLFPGGCGLDHLSINLHDEDHHRPVRVRRVHRTTVHVCTHGCDNHYWNGARVVVLTGHHHGSDCGHHWDGTHWAVIRKGRVGRVERRHAVVRAHHLCTPNCHGHYWDGSALVTLSGHHHGLDCGHQWDGTHWLIVARGGVARVHGSPKVIKRSHRHGRSCGHAYDAHRTRWITVKKGHVHGPRCGHVHLHGRWTLRIH